jgi:hypothetical protein
MHHVAADIAAAAGHQDGHLGPRCIPICSYRSNVKVLFQASAAPPNR